MVFAWRKAPDRWHLLCTGALIAQHRRYRWNSNGLTLTLPVRLRLLWLERSPRYVQKPCLSPPKARTDRALSVGRPLFDRASLSAQDSAVAAAHGVGCGSEPSEVGGGEPHEAVYEAVSMRISERCLKQGLERR